MARNIAENFNSLGRVYEGYRQTDRQTDGRTDGRTTTYSEREREKSDVRVFKREKNNNILLTFTM